MQAGKNNLEIHLMSLFGRYFFVLKLERQLDHVVFQHKAGRKKFFSISQASCLGCLLRRSPGHSLWLFQGLQGQGEHMEPCWDSCPLNPLTLILSLKHKPILQSQLFAGRQQNLYCHIPVVLVSHLKLSANSAVIPALQITSQPSRQLQK